MSGDRSGGKKHNFLPGCTHPAARAPRCRPPPAARRTPLPAFSPGGGGEGESAEKSGRGWKRRGACNLQLVAEQGGFPRSCVAFLGAAFKFALLGASRLPWRP